MTAAAEVALIVDAVILVRVAPIEMFLLDRPWEQKLLAVSFAHRADVELWAFCIGVRNLMGAAGVFIGAWMLHTGQAGSGLVVMIVVACTSCSPARPWGSPTS